MQENLSQLSTEKSNPESAALDSLTVEQALALMNHEDQKVAPVIQKHLAEITPLVEKVIATFKAGGRLIYLGAGTSGRLGVLDAAECVPTFGVEPTMVVGLLAGGEKAMITAVEGAEDSPEQGAADLKNIQLKKTDFVLGIAASGRTPYVIGGLQYAKEIGAATGSLACNLQAKISEAADFPIEVDFGPEVLTGSTRLKAATGQKLILNMISTISMVGIGKVYKNLMVDVKPTNEKLKNRARRIIMAATDVDFETADQAYLAANRNVKVAIITLLTGLDVATAAAHLKTADGYVKEALKL
ncbi:N-acetylmuramic acid 6-phosphate etherase [Enterococcus sp. HY326]|uniref:N-acetylmuramic acid 6-phosphate etherase n=1 Tax=Enterococcus sp. HY326 TaxID=2971265 RepID=UPI00223ECB64|nr:N-acetylmuramic acid 6-phosphate etherase [Enterococcus sp. HY326]